MARRTRPSTDTGRCGACGTPVIRQVVEVLNVVADTTPIPPGTDHQIRTPNRLTWCAPPDISGRLRWIHHGDHPDPCPHPHHADHQCTTHRAPAPAADTLF